MSQAMKTGLVALSLAVCVLPTGASAIIFFCGDVCFPSSSCGRICADDNTGDQIDCGIWECCIFDQTNCGAEIPTIRKPKAVNTVCTVDESPEKTPIPAFFAAR